MKLYVRIALGMFLALVLTSAALLFIFGQRMRNRVADEHVLAATNTTALLADRVRAASDRDAVLDWARKRFDLPLEVRPAAEVDAEVASDGTPTVERHKDESYVYVRLSPSEVLVAGPVAHPDPRSVGDGLIFLATALSVVLVTAFLVTLPIARRLRILGRATRRLRDGDMSARAEVGGGGAIAELAVDFNHMAAEIERLLENQKQLLQAVSHEFRTPTTRIRFGLDLLASAKTDEERQKRFDEIDQSLTDLDELVEELLTFVRFEGANPALRTETINVGDTVDEIIDASAVLQGAIEVSVVAHDDAPCTIVANPRYFRRVVENLVRNAIRHAKSRVTIEYQSAGDAVLLLVHDDGPGVPREERDRVWEPFARVDASRSRDSGGYGLGLAIVRRIMAWHGGKAHVDDSRLGGAMFVTRWPVSGADRPRTD